MLQQLISLLNSALTAFPIHAGGELSKVKNIVLTIHRQRTKTAVKSNDFLPEDLKKTYRGEQFLLYEDNAMIILITKSNRFLNNVNIGLLMERSK